MAQLKDTVVQGSLRVTDSIFTNSLTASDLITARALEITDQNAISHITLPRNTYNYMSVPSGGELVLTSGTIMGTEYGIRIKVINDPKVTGGYISPGVTNKMTLGDSNLKWANVYATTLNGSLAASNITGTLGVGHGGTGTDTFSADYVLVGNGTSAISSRGLKITGAAGADTTIETASGKKLTIAGGSTSYISTAAGTSLIFQKATTECARFNTSGMFQLNSSVTQTTHKLLVNGDSAFTGKIAFTNSANTLTEYASISYNTTNKTIDSKFLWNTVVTGTGTAGVTYVAASGDTAATPGKPALWKFNCGIATPANGTTLLFEIPVAGHDSGVFISTDNGTTYKPVSISGASRLTTHYGNGHFVLAVYDANGSTNSVYPVAGATARSNVTGGCWRTVNYYDSGNDLGIRMYNYTSGRNADYPLLVSATALTSQIGTLNSNGSVSNTIYAQIWDSPNDGSHGKTPTLNPNTGLMKMHSLTIGNYASFTTSGLSLGNTTATSNAQNLLTLNGHMVINGSYNTSNSYSEGVRINRSANGWADIVLGGTQGTTSGTGNGVWIIGAVSTPANATTAAASITNSQFYLAYNGASSATSRIQGHAATGFSIRPRLGVNADVNTSYNFYVNGTSYLNESTTLNGNIISGTVNYGTTLPTTDLTPGRLFFQTSENEYELPVGGDTGSMLVKASVAERDVIWSNTIYNLTVTTNITAYGNITGAKVYNAVWNDYAECRSSWVEEPGRVIVESKNGTMELATERLMAGCKIISDTYGNLMGQSKTARTPIAVAGRVLAYPYQAREKYELGAAVCSGPNGTVDIMTREEIREYPERILGTVSEIPDYDVWYAGNEQNPTSIQVNGRIWIYVR